MQQEVEQILACSAPSLDGVLVAAHELKAPLAILRQLALALPDQDPAGEQIRAEMVTVSERALKQVNDLAKLRRLEDGLFAMEPVAIREVCEAASRELDPLFLQQRRALATTYRNRARLVTANRELLHSVVYNFLLNAIHYSDPDTHAELTVKNSRYKVRVCVRDYGPALPVDVWRELRRGWLARPTSISMRPGSSGLGLYIASQFSRYMHAAIGAVRHRDGTSFYVELPISTQGSLF